MFFAIKKVLKWHEGQLQLTKNTFYSEKTKQIRDKLKGSTNFYSWMKRSKYNTIEKSNSKLSMNENLHETSNNNAEQVQSAPLTHMEMKEEIISMTKSMGKVLSKQLESTIGIFEYINKKLVIIQQFWEDIDSHFTTHLTNEKEYDSDSSDENSEEVLLSPIATIAITQQIKIYRKKKFHEMEVGKKVGKNKYYFIPFKPLSELYKNYEGTIRVDEILSAYHVGYEYAKSLHFYSKKLKAVYCAVYEVYTWKDFKIIENSSWRESKFIANTIFYPAAAKYFINPKLASTTVITIFNFKINLFKFYNFFNFLIHFAFFFSLRFFAYIIYSFIFGYFANIFYTFRET